MRQERVLKEKNAIIRMKDEEIAELKSKMDDMAEEFGEMLRVSIPILLPIRYRALTLNDFFRKLSRKCARESKCRAVDSMDRIFSFNSAWKN